MKAEDVRPLLPALVHLARFPTCNLRLICERWGVDKARVMLAVAEIEGGAGAGDGLRLTEGVLASAAKRWKVSLPAWQGLPAVSSGAALRALELRKVERRPAMGARVVVPEPSPVPAWVLGRPRSRRDEYVRVLDLVLAEKLAETRACKQVGLSLASWRYFRESRGLGRRGELHRAKALALWQELLGGVRPVVRKVKGGVR